ncbi:Peptidase_C48 domain-containing protein, partial [Cephalotus follicularis]
DQEVLKYLHVTLRESELEILKGPRYLNDNIIDFCFAYLSSCWQSDDILLVSPSISFWIAHCQESPDSLKGVLLSDLNMGDKQLIVFPINDNGDLSRADGGTHWSLLVYYKRTNMFVHHDSFNGMNTNVAMKFYHKIKGFFGTAIFDVCGYDPRFKRGPTPQQSNHYDCGLYVIAIARVICQWYMGLSTSTCNYDDDDLWFSYVEDNVSDSVEFSMRTEILNLIQEL